MLLLINDKSQRLFFKSSNTFIANLPCIYLRNTELSKGSEKHNNGIVMLLCHDNIFISQIKKHCQLQYINIVSIKSRIAENVFSHLTHTNTQNENYLNIYSNVITYILVKRISMMKAWDNLRDRSQSQVLSRTGRAHSGWAWDHFCRQNLRVKYILCISIHLWITMPATSTLSNTKSTKMYLCG